jgi:hypothetical protein
VTLRKVVLFSERRRAELDGAITSISDAFFFFYLLCHLIFLSVCHGGGPSSAPVLYCTVAGGVGCCFDASDMRPREGQR